MAQTHLFGTGMLIWDKDSGGLLLPGAPRTALAYLSSECVFIIVRT